jgi:hypothetical protein
MTTYHHYSTIGQAHKKGERLTSPAIFFWVACGLLRRIYQDYRSATAGMRRTGDPSPPVDRAAPMDLLIGELRFVGDQAQPGGTAKRLHTVVDMQLIVDIRQVEIHRALADKQRVGHFLA